MGLFGKLMEKPWLSGPEAPSEGDSLLIHASRTGLRLYLAVATVLFLIVTMSYVMRMLGHELDGRFAHDWQPMPEPRLLWFNTGVLILSSVAWEWARLGGRRGSADSMRTGLFAGGALAIVFLVGQLALWRQFYDAGYFLTTSPANAFFYLITALHGAHLLGGLFVWTRASLRAIGGAGPAELQTSISLCALYWHFLLIVWLAMFALLLAT